MSVRVLVHSAVGAALIEVSPGLGTQGQAVMVTNSVVKVVIVDGSSEAVAVKFGSAVGVLVLVCTGNEWRVVFRKGRAGLSLGTSGVGSGRWLETTANPVSMRSRLLKPPEGRVWRALRRIFL